MTFPLILIGLFVAADRFSLDGLKSLAIFELSSALTIQNVVEVYVDVISALPIIGKKLEHIKMPCCKEKQIYTFT